MSVYRYTVAATVCRCRYAVGVTVWLVCRCRYTVAATGAFLETFQKLSDFANGTQGVFWTDFCVAINILMCWG